MYDCKSYASIIRFVVGGGDSRAVADALELIVMQAVIKGFQAGPALQVLSSMCVWLMVYFEDINIAGNKTQPKVA